MTTKIRPFAETQAALKALADQGNEFASQWLWLLDGETKAVQQKMYESVREYLDYNGKHNPNDPQVNAIRKALVIPDEADTLSSEDAAIFKEEFEDGLAGLRYLQDK